jgi:outer membrane protein assembly factor BamB
MKVTDDPTLPVAMLSATTAFPIWKFQLKEKFPVFAGNQISIIQLSTGHFILYYLLLPAALRHWVRLSF